MCRSIQKHAETCRSMQGYAAVGRNVQECPEGRRSGQEYARVFLNLDSNLHKNFHYSAFSIIVVACVAAIITQ